MGGSGGGSWDSRSPDELKKLVREAEATTVGEAFKAELAGILADQLAGYNTRDVALTNRRLEDVKKKLEGELEGTCDFRFGGSVAKHTYIDGLSDIDSLLLINDAELLDKDPGTVIDVITAMLNRQSNGEYIATAGRHAITLEYRDGMSIQLLPAIRTAAGYKIAAFAGGRWSEIDPKGFTGALTKVNEQCGGAVVPVIKLAKAINAKFPEKMQLTGYHVESIAISAFRDYEGARDSATMLTHFFDRAKDLVLTPIRDRTGQSVHVDEYLGAERSAERTQASHLLDRTAKRLKNATAAESLDQWKALFDE